MEENKELQLEYLARQLARHNLVPFRGYCVDCEAKDYNSCDCAKCWLDAADKSATQQKALASLTTKQAERPAAEPGAIIRRLTVAPPIPFTRLAVQDWPQAWQDDIAVAKKGWLCWTWPYMYQYNDFDDRDVEYVLRVLHEGIGEEKKQASTFWPCDNFNVFWSGLRELGVRMVCVFSQRSACDIGIPEEEWRPLHWEIRNGVIIATLWGVKELIEQQSRIDDCITFLNTTFRQLRL